MSLINKMLQDLEKRKPKENAGEKETAMMNKMQVSPDKKTQNKSSRLRIIILLILLVIVVGLILKKPMVELFSKTVHVAKISSLISSSHRKISEEELKASAANIAILQKTAIEHANNNSILDLFLSHPVHYELYSNSNGEAFKIILDDTKLTRPLSAINKDPIIKTVTSQTVHGNLELTITVWPDTKIKKVNLEKSKPTKLQLTFYNDISKNEAKLEKVAVPLSPDELAKRQYQEALNFLTNKQPEKAINQLKQILTNIPDSLNVRKTLLILLYQCGDYAEMAQYLRDGLNQLPDYIPFIELKARLLFAEGSPKDALKTLLKFSPPINVYPNYYTLMAALQQLLGHSDIAAQLYGRLLVLDNTNSVWWMGLGIALESINHPNAAIDAYQHAVSMSNLSPDVEAFVADKIRQLGG